MRDGKSKKTLENIIMGINDLSERNFKNKSNGWEHRDSAYAAVIAVIQNEIGKHNSDDDDKGAG